MQDKLPIEAKTFTCTYSDREDRLLLTLNYEDYKNRVDFWITRSFLLKIIPYLFDYTSEKDSLKDQSHRDKDSVISTDSSTFVLTQKDPILLESINFLLLENGNMKLTFKNFEKNIEYFSFLDENSYKNLVNLLMKTAPAFDWGIYTDI